MSRQWLCILATLVIAACGSDDKPGAAVGADAGADTLGGGVDATTGDAATTDAGASDAATASDGGGTCPGATGCTCAANDDCDIALCLETAKGSVCPAPCTSNDSCATGEVCVGVPGSGGDAISVCVERAVHLCDPCKSNAACGGPGLADARCVDRGDQGAFCGVPCGGDAPACPAGSTCQDVTDVAGEASKQCMPDAGATCACSPLAMKKELSTTCKVSGDGGACPGVRACLAEGKENAPSGGGLSACIGAKPVAETCNGADDDCDGVTDDDAKCDDGDPCTADACTNGACSSTPSLGACDDGDACTEGDTCAGGKCVGAAKDCDDSKPCTADSCDKASGCTHAPAAAGAPCDDGDACTADDACDTGACLGKKKSCDDGNACTTDACDASSGECKSTAGSGSCDDGDLCTEGDACGKDPGSGQLVCIAGKAKDCDDSNPCTNDSCDAKTGCANAVDVTKTQPCYTGAPSTKGVGACVGGTQSCKADGSLGSCDGEVTPSGKEACDGKDDTCDGKTDEGCPGGGKPQLSWRLGSTTVAGSAGTTQVRVFVGGDSVVGPSTAAGKSGVDIGFYAWVKSLLK